VEALQTQIRTLDTNISEMSARIQESSGTLSGVAERQLTLEKKVPSLQTVEQLTDLVVTMENQRVSLLNEYKPDDRLVKEIDQQIRQTRAELDAATGRTAQEQSTDVNPIWQQVRLRNLQDKISLQALIQQKTAVAAQLAQSDARLKQVQAMTVQFNLLKSKADGLKESYQLYAQKQEQAQIEDAMDARQLLNVTVAERPTLSYVQTQPRPVRTLALGFVTSLFLSFSLVYIAELARSTVVSPSEIVSVSKYPVLGSVALAADTEPPPAPRNYTRALKSADLINALRTSPHRRGLL
jgi:uncharacterized protein involved in exopolysaccharide biosynthesis